MRAPKIPYPSMTVCWSDPLEQLGIDAYTRLAFETKPAADDAMRVLEECGLDATNVGPFEVRLTPTLARIRGRYLLLREACEECLEVTSHCEEEAIAALAAAGHHFDPSRVRFLHDTPGEWKPENTMRRVGCGRALLGSVPEGEGCRVALPFEPAPGSIQGATGWATWVAVRADHLETL